MISIINNFNYLIILSSGKKWALISSDDQSRLAGWLARLGGPGYKGSEDRDRAVVEMRAEGASRLLPQLIPLTGDDLETRCQACEAILLVDSEHGTERVLPLLSDPDDRVRWYACWCLCGRGDERATTPLMAVLKSDQDPNVRGLAAMALGRIGGPAVIPAFLSTMASDHEVNENGHTPSHCAAMALDDILGTEETRIKVSESVCKMREGEPDLDRLRRLAEQRYQQWLGAQAS